MPSAGAFYWMTGAIENALGASLSSILWCFIVKGKTLICQKNIRWRIVVCLLALLIPSLHEAFGAILVLSLAVRLVAAYLTGSPFKRTLIPVLLFAAIELWVVVIAAGKHTRLSQSWLKQDGSQSFRLVAFGPFCYIFVTNILSNVKAPFFYLQRCFILSGLRLRKLSLLGRQD